MVDLCSRATTRCDNPVTSKRFHAGKVERKRAMKRCHSHEAESNDIIFDEETSRMRSCTACQARKLSVRGFHMSRPSPGSPLVVSYNQDMHHALGDPNIS